MSKRNKIIYWIATVWLSLGMLSSGFVQLFQNQKEMEFIANLGYPGYFIMILGVWKILGVIAILIPKFPIQKEWAYAGFFFCMTGAALSHIAAGTTNEIFPSLLLLILTVVSYYFRPADRKVISVNQ
jgi:hypothetical protein